MVSPNNLVDNTVNNIQTIGNNTGMLLDITLHLRLHYIQGQNQTIVMLVYC